MNDLYSYFRFLKWAPFDKQEVFKAQIGEAIKVNPEKGYRKLQQILKAWLLLTHARVTCIRSHLCMHSACMQLSRPWRELCT